MGSRIVLPVVVRNKAIAAGAAWWIDALAEIVAGLEHEWSITVGRPFDEGTEAFVAEAAMASGARRRRAACRRGPRRRTG
ncbi:MAG TPA: hypothetical protein VK860_06615 [Ilumatobacteraceae bacterium]|nr:hypothetical protein [Ilumatobacteraceae bacterium]